MGEPNVLAVGTFLVGLGLGAAVVRWRFPRTIVRVETVVEKVVEEVPITTPMPWQERRFNVVVSTNSGAEARTVFETLVPRAKSDGVIQFFDGIENRGTKRG